jgi:hypothetical protein
MHILVFTVGTTNLPNNSLTRLSCQPCTYLGYNFRYMFRLFMKPSSGIMDSSMFVIPLKRTECVGVLISLSKVILFLQDNTAPHKAAITGHKLADLHFEFLDHPVYSPDLAPSNYYLFPNLFIKPKTYQPPRVVSECMSSLVMWTLCWYTDNGNVWRHLRMNVSNFKTETGWISHHHYELCMIKVLRPTSMNCRIPSTIFLTFSFAPMSRAAHWRSQSVLPLVPLDFFCFKSRYNN